MKTVRDLVGQMLANVRVFLIVVLGFMLAVYAAWMVNAQLGYGYSWLYHAYDTDQHIAKYAPQNRFRAGFETTLVAEHKAAFQSIVDSVHDDGKGLADIQYRSSGKGVPLLHQAEIIHLQDVANLINELHNLAVVIFLLWWLLIFWQVFLIRKRVSYVRHSALGLVSVLTMLIMITLVVFMVWGAKAIFYQLHIMIFPADHQWFFYYQDSLMSTLMKAPDLFAGIAMQILGLSVVIFIVVGLVFKKVAGYQRSSSQY